VTLNKTFYSLIFKQEAVADTSYCHIFFRIASLEEAFIRNIIIILCINYVIITRINDNNEVINNNYRRLQDLILLFKTPMATRKNFFEIYRQFGHAPSKSFASPVVGDTPTRLKAVQPKIRVSFPGTGKIFFSSSKRPHSSGAHTTSYSMGTRSYFPGDEWDRE
jgi:hypothetical protein